MSRDQLSCAARHFFGYDTAPKLRATRNCRRLSGEVPVSRKKPIWMPITASFFCLCLTPTAFAAPQGANSLASQHIDFIDYRGVPQSEEDWNLFPLADQGSWMGFFPPLHRLHGIRGRFHGSVRVVQRAVDQPAASPPLHPVLAPGSRLSRMGFEPLHTRLA